MTVELLWADQTPAYGSSGLISDVSLKGVGKDTKIVVKSGSTGKEGNAVVVVRSPKYNNNIIWSWHIWVTNYDRDTDTDLAANTFYDSINNKYYTFMDRELGAISNQPGTADAYGLFYQWGRKDPFPGADVPEGNSLYRKTGLQSIGYIPY